MTSDGLAAPAIMSHGLLPSEPLVREERPLHASISNVDEQHFRLARVWTARLSAPTHLCRTHSAGLTVTSPE